MVTLGLRQEVEEFDQELEEKVTRQVAEIMEAAKAEEEKVQDPIAPTPAWKFSMPFAGVRYFSYE